MAGEGTAGVYALRAGRPAGPDWAGWLARPPELAYEAFVPALWWGLGSTRVRESRA